MERTSQVEQLKLNVSNINSFLISKNKEQRKLRADKKRLELRRADTLKREKEERKLEIKSSPVGKVSEKVKESVSSGGSILDKLLNFGGLLLAGILVNNLPAIIEKVRGIIDSVVNFITPIRSGFNLIMAFFTGDIDESKYDADKKRFDDALSELDKEGGLIDQLAEKMGPFGELVKLLKPAVDAVRNKVGTKKMKPPKQDAASSPSGMMSEHDFYVTQVEAQDDSDAYDRLLGAETYEEYKKIFLDNAEGVDGSQLVVTSEMGMRDLALSPGMHMGVDIAGPEGTPLVSFSKGTVTAKGYDGGYGNYVVWTDDQNIEHFYGHLKNPSPVNIGDSLTKGQIIGLMGNTGRSSGPHLHWETSTVIGDTGRSKAAVLSRFNPLSKYGKLDPFKIEQIKNSTESSTGRGGAKISVKPNDMIINPDPRKRRGSMTIAVQRVNTIQTVPYMMPVPTKSRSSSTSQPQLPSIWSA